MLSIDDLANRSHDCDALLDQNYFRNFEDRYKGITPLNCHRLLGPNYALLGPEYPKARRGCATRTSIKRILIFFGGSDASNLSCLTLQALSESRFHDVPVDVVCPPANPYRAELAQRAASRKNTVIYGALPHLADLMVGADLAIGAGGTATWERLCAGLPSLVVSVARNQEAICSELADKGLIKYLGRAEDVSVSKISAALEFMANNLIELEECRLQGQCLVDGHGAKRVADVLYPISEHHLRLRGATGDDLLIYYRWANDSDVRRQSLRSEPISMAEHVEWFHGRLTAQGAKLFVLEGFGLPIGQIRFQLVNDDAWISYSLDTQFRGRGWGAELVRLGMQKIRDHLQQEKLGSVRFMAEVKPGNSASAAIFLKLGFIQEMIQETNTLVFTQRYS